MASVDVRFQKVLIGVYGNQNFLKKACAMAKINFCNFGTNGLCRTLLKTRRARLSEILIILCGV